MLSAVCKNCNVVITTNDETVLAKLVITHQKIEPSHKFVYGGVDPVE